MKIGMIVLSATLVAMWLIGIATHQVAWLGWLDLVAGLVSLLAVLVPMRRTGVLAASPFVIGVGLTALWIIAFATGITTWLAWLTFLASIAYFALGATTSAATPIEPHRARA